jgi:3-oxo-5-alpha-steroid 4-dehydrogenase 1
VNALLSVIAEYAPYIVLGAALVVGPVLLKIPAPYGRHARTGWGPSMPARAGWMLMESVSLLGVPLAFFALSPFAGSFEARWLLLPWVLHYAQRTLVYPSLMKSPKPIPISTVAMAVVFNSLNALGNGAELAPRGPSVLVLVGVPIFAAGVAINLYSDAVLRRLRAGGQRGYQVPTGGLYRWVSCPNYLGECIEWLGFALCASTLAALAFFVFTVANLLPRALSHHRWYRAQFPDYPKDRKAMIPGVL